MTKDLLLTRGQLRAQGYDAARIRAEIDAGILERLITGWYCRPGADRDAVRAMRLGGRISCVSALRISGAWYPPDVGLHLGFPSHASGRRLATRDASDGTVAHWHPEASATGSAFAITPVARSIEGLLLCQPPHFAVAVLDSLLQRRVITRNRLDAVILAGPRRMRFVAARLNADSAAGIESIVRFLLASRGIRVAVQVVLRERFRVDLLIDGWLVLEIDGRTTLAQAKAFTKDRVRSAMIMRDGRIVLQFAYATVVYDSGFVIDAVLDVMTQHAPVRR